MWRQKFFKLEKINRTLGVGSFVIWKKKNFDIAK